jgi:hypothetical protein
VAGDAQQPVTTGAPPLQELGGAESTRLCGHRRLERAEVADHLVHARGERVGFLDGEHRVAVEPCEVMDLVSDRPTGCGRGQIPLFRGDRRDQRVEIRVLGREVVAQRGEVRGRHRPANVLDCRRE